MKNLKKKKYLKLFSMSKDGKDTSTLILLKFSHFDRTALKTFPFWMKITFACRCGIKMFAMVIGKSVWERLLLQRVSWSYRILLDISFYNLAGGSSSYVGGMARSSSLRRRAELLATKRSSAVEPSSQVICFIKTLTDMKIRTYEKHPPILQKYFT